MLNDEIKDYWEDESYVYSDIIKKSLDDEGKTHGQIWYWEMPPKRKAGNP